MQMLNLEFQTLRVVYKPEFICEPCCQNEFQQGDTIGIIAPYSHVAV